MPLQPPWFNTRKRGSRDRRLAEKSPMQTTVAKAWPSTSWQPLATPNSPWLLFFMFFSHFRGRIMRLGCPSLEGPCMAVSKELSNVPCCFLPASKQGNDTSTWELLWSISGQRCSEQSAQTGFHGIIPVLLPVAESL